METETIEVTADERATILAGLSLYHTLVDPYEGREKARELYMRLAGVDLFPGGE